MTNAVNDTKSHNYSPAVGGLFVRLAQARPIATSTKHLHLASISLIGGELMAPSEHCIFTFPSGGTNDVAVDVRLLLEDAVRFKVNPEVVCIVPTIVPVV